MRTLPWIALLLALGWLLGGYTSPPPLRIGLLIDLTGRTALINVDARNAVLLATERINRLGGVQGRRLELVMEDFGARPGHEQDSASALLRQDVRLVLGPFSSGVARQLLPLFNAAGVLLLDPAATATTLAGREDQFLRLNRSGRDSAQVAATLLHARGLRRLAMATYVGGSDSNGAWRDAFIPAFRALGGTVVVDTEFGLTARPGAREVVARMLDANPDGLVFVGNGINAARLAQQAFKLGSRLPMLAPDWANNPALLEQGGRAVEGMLLGSTSRLGDRSPRFLEFRATFVARFGYEPGDRAIAAYDGLTVAAHALALATPGESARDAVLRNSPYQGLQQQIVFDRFGDAKRGGDIVVVRDGRFVPLPDAAPAAPTER